MLFEAYFRATRNFILLFPFLFIKKISGSFPLGLDDRVNYVCYFLRLLNFKSLVNVKRKRNTT